MSTTEKLALFSTVYRMWMFHQIPLTSAYYWDYKTLQDTLLQKNVYCEVSDLESIYNRMNGLVL